MIGTHESLSVNVSTHVPPRLPNTDNRRIIEAGEIAELGDHRERDEPLHTAQCLQGRDDRL